MFRDIQIVIITNFVIVSTVRMRRLNWIFSGRTCSLTGNTVPNYYKQTKYMQLTSILWSISQQIATRDELYGK